MLHNGEVNCSNGNEIGSTCTFSCPRMYEGDAIDMMPSFSDAIKCLPNGKWDYPIPNCRSILSYFIKCFLTNTILSL